VRTGVMQLVIMVAGICLLTAPLAVLRAGGIAELRAGLPPGHFSFPTSPGVGGPELMSLFLIVGLTYIVGPDIYSRLFLAKDGRTAKMSAFFAAICLIPFALSVVLIGMCARAEFPQIRAEESVPTVIRAVLPAGLSGVAIAAFLAALMSSADTLLMTTSTVSAWDIYKQHINPASDDEKVLRVSKGAMVVIGLLALGVALYVGQVIDALLLAYAIFSGGLIIPIIAGFYGKRIGVNSNGALAGLIGGGAVAIFLKILRVPPLDPKMVLGMVTCLTFLFAVSKLMPEK